MPKKAAFAFLVVFLAVMTVHGALAVAAEPDNAAAPLPSLTVNGHGEVTAAPDVASVRLGAVAQAKEAAEAQKQVNLILERALTKLKTMKIPEEEMETLSLSLVPVYTNEGRVSGDSQDEPRIVGYRASNTISVRTADLKQIGAIIDAGLAAGVNQLLGVSFELKDDSEQRRQALRLAAQEARTKAEAIASALGVSLVSVQEVVESGVGLVRPQIQLGRTYAAEAKTPVQPGEITVEASVTVSFRIAEK